jgi:hypothetical protein
MTFVIEAENRAEVLARVVQPFQDLKVEIEALYVVRRRDSPRYSLLRFSTTSRMNLRAPMNTFTAQKRAEGH